MVPKNAGVEKNMFFPWRFFGYPISRSVRTAHLVVVGILGSFSRSPRRTLGKVDKERTLYHNFRQCTSTTALFFLEGEWDRGV